MQRTLGSIEMAAWEKEQREGAEERIAQLAAAAVDEVGRLEEEKV